MLKQREKTKSQRCVWITITWIFIPDGSISHYNVLTFFGIQNKLEMTYLKKIIKKKPLTCYRYCYKSTDLLSISPLHRFGWHREVIASPYNKQIPILYTSITKRKSNNKAISLFCEKTALNSLLCTLETRNNRVRAKKVPNI